MIQSHSSKDDAHREYVRNCLKIRLLLVGVFQPYVVLQMYLGIQPHKNISTPVQYLITSISTHGSPSTNIEHRHYYSTPPHLSLTWQQTHQWHVPYISKPERHLILIVWNTSQQESVQSDHRWHLSTLSKILFDAKLCHVLRTSKVHRSLNTSSNHLISSPKHFL